MYSSLSSPPSPSPSNLLPLVSLPPLLLLLLLPISLPAPSQTATLVVVPSMTSIASFEQLFGSPSSNTQMESVAPELWSENKQTKMETTKIYHYLQTNVSYKLDTPTCRSNAASEMSLPIWTIWRSKVKSSSSTVLTLFCRCFFLIRPNFLSGCHCQERIIAQLYPKYCTSFTLVANITHPFYTGRINIIISGERALGY